jgi:hypothetical protein
MKTGQRIVCKHPEIINYSDGIPVDKVELKLGRIYTVDSIIVADYNDAVYLGLKEISFPNWTPYFNAKNFSTLRKQKLERILK